ncbi:MAG: hypothetical protein J6Q54_02190 [Oscillospiraceae bacterium]|nr:hypothetical protein [Oscillospiraceae bacterium]
MSDINYSSLLQQLLQEAERLGKTSGVVSAENLLISVIDKLQNMGPSAEGELLKLGQMMNTTFGNLQPLAEALRAHISVDVMLDNLYLEQKLQDAKDLAEQVKADEVDSVMVVSCILSNPTSLIRNLMEKKKEEPTHTTGTSTSAGSAGESLADQISRMLGISSDGSQSGSGTTASNSTTTSGNSGFPAIIERLAEPPVQREDPDLRRLQSRRKRQPRKRTRTIC